MRDFGRILIIMGVILIASGGIILIGLRLFPSLGNLPGDLRFERGNVRFYFPFATMLLLSILGTLILNIILRFFR